MNDDCLLRECEGPAGWRSGGGWRAAAAPEDVGSTQKLGYEKPILEESSHRRSAG